ncbi:MAG: efflux RND transporter periplasmic adaptor subunit [Deltaproteobacteria bacterium]|nr:efflux RND transporter periplasmic adaptor subunit [Deltaproteobacteria bacterium]
MKKAIPILVVLAAVAVYAYVTRIAPSRIKDPAVRGSGTVEATEALVSSKIMARIVSIDAVEGDVVEAGRVMVRLACDDLAVRKTQAEAQVAQAEAARAQAEAAYRQVMAQLSPLDVQKENAAREFARATSLRASDSAPQYAVDQAETAVKAVREQIGAARSGVEVARRTTIVAEAAVNLAGKGVEAANVALAECEIRAPMAGVVMARDREPGEMVLPGATILKIGRLDEVHTWIYVANEEVGRVRLRDRVVLKADTYPGRSFEGAVARVNEQAEFTPKSIQTKEDRTRLVYGVKVVVRNADRALMPGMPVEAEIVEAGKR